MKKLKKNKIINFLKEKKTNISKVINKKKKLRNKIKKKKINNIKNVNFHKNSVILKKNKKKINFSKIKKDYDINNIKKEKNNITSSIKKKNIKNKDFSNQYIIKNKNKKYPIKYFKKIIIKKKYTIDKLSNKFGVKVDDILKEIKNNKLKISFKKKYNKDNIKLIFEKIGFKVIIKNLKKKEKQISFINNNIKEKRAPIVTIMGHVDHGKTSLIDFIRSTKIVNKECGGITQHIGAYHIKFKNEIITFLDTPGHKAFKKMRYRGAKITDIIILIIAADDGIMPQTIESINHAKSLNVPIIVAINKIDKCSNNTVKIKNELSKYDIVSEEWGGDTIFVEISAILGTGVDELLETILLQAEMLELKVSLNKFAKGVIIESYMDLGRGPVSTIILKEGILHKGDVILSGLEYGKIRGIKNEFGKYIEKVIPSIPVEILGLSGILNVGDEIVVVENEKIARSISIDRKKKMKIKKFSNYQRIGIDEAINNIHLNNLPKLNIILKTDVQGSLEAIYNSLIKLSNNKVVVNIIYSGIGMVSVTDVSSSLNFNAIILGFNVRVNSLAKTMILKEKVKIFNYSVIYKLLDDVKLLLLDLLKPKYYINKIGLLKVKNVFKNSKNVVIAGCVVIKGFIKINNNINVIRNDKIIFKGELKSIRHFKENVKKVTTGLECGIIIKDFNDVVFGDMIEVIDNIKN